MIIPDEILLAVKKNSTQSMIKNEGSKQHEKKINKEEVAKKIQEKANYIARLKLHFKQLKAGVRLLEKQHQEKLAIEKKEQLQKIERNIKRAEKELSNLKKIKNPPKQNNIISSSSIVIRRTNQSINKKFHTEKKDIKRPRRHVKRDRDCKVIGKNFGKKTTEFKYREVLGDSTPKAEARLMKKSNRWDDDSAIAFRKEIGDRIKHDDRHSNEFDRFAMK